MTPPPDTKLGERSDFRELADHLERIAVWTADEDRGLTYVSAGFEDIWGVSPAAVEADLDLFIERIHPEDRDRVLAQVNRPMSEVEPNSIEHRVVKPDGTVRWVEVRTFPVHDDGSVSELVGVTVDITERRRRTRELEVLNRVLRHDVRNDMSVVLGWLDLLEPAVENGDVETLERLKAASEHVVELTEIASDYVDVVLDGDDFELSEVDLGDTLETELETRRMSYPDATFEVRGSIPDVTVDANGLLASVFRNLLNNAVQHSDRRSPTVSVSVETTPGTVTVRVADDGPGVADERKDTIFGEGASGLDSPGTGMGLFLCRELVTAYDGRIWVEDAEPSGAVFCVELPRRDRGSAGAS